MMILALAGCRQPDAEDARLCRIALVALVDPEPAPTITQQRLLPPSPTTRDIRIDYLAGKPTRAGFVQCRFAAADDGRLRPDLIAVATDAGVLSLPRLLMLKRFWLDTAEGQAADPVPVADAAQVPVLPVAAAYALQQALNALPAMAIYGLLAAAYSLVYGLVGRINLAFGEMAAIGGLGAITGVALFARGGDGVLIASAILVGLWVASLHGYAIVRAVFLPLRRVTDLQGLIATVGLALALNEYLRLAQGPAPAWIAPLRTTPVAIARGGTFIVTETPIGFAVTATALVAAIALLLLLRATQFGRAWRAMADDARAAALMGVDPVHVFATTFVLAAALAGLAGAIVVLVYGSFGTTLGATLGLKALLAAVLGGIGSVPGAFAGGLVLGLFEAVWSAAYPIDYRDLAVFVLLAVCLVIRPGGLLGYADLSPRRV